MARAYPFDPKQESKLVQDIWAGEKIENIKNGKNFAAKTDGSGFLSIAAAAGNSTLVSNLLIQGCPVDQQNSNGDTALARAVRYGHADCVKILMQANANPLNRSKWERSPLVRAAGHSDSRNGGNIPKAMETLLNCMLEKLDKGSIKKELELAIKRANYKGKGTNLKCLQEWQRTHELERKIPKDLEDVRVEKYTPEPKYDPKTNTSSFGCGSKNKCTIS